MVTRRLCAFRFPTGEPCHLPPLHDGDFCLMHSPEHAKEVQEAMERKTHVISSRVLKKSLQVADLACRLW